MDSCLLRDDGLDYGIAGAFRRDEVGVGGAGERDVFRTQLPW